MESYVNFPAFGKRGRNIHLPDWQVIRIYLHYFTGILLFLSSFTYSRFKEENHVNRNVYRFYSHQHKWLGS